MLSVGIKGSSMSEPSSETLRRLDEIKRELTEFRKDYDRTRDKVVVQQNQAEEHDRVISELSNTFPRYVERIENIRLTLDRIEREFNAHREKLQVLERVVEKNNMVIRAVRWMTGALVLTVLSVSGSVVYHLALGGGG